MKTPKQIKLLNFNDVAFFKGINTSEAKWEIAHFFYNTDDIWNTDEKGNYLYLTKTETPKLKITDKVDKSEIETQIRSCSKLDGLNSIDYTIKTYNKEIPLSAIRDFCESKTFQKALRFTGKHSILNDILNDVQLRKCQEYWLFKNVYMVNNWTKNCISFIVSNNWSNDFLISKGFSINEIEKNINPKED